jgi:hypothetical protein
MVDFLCALVEGGYVHVPEIVLAMHVTERRTREFLRSQEANSEWSQQYVSDEMTIKTIGWGPGSESSR